MSEQNTQAEEGHAQNGEGDQRNEVSQRGGSEENGESDQGEENEVNVPQKKRRLRRGEKEEASSPKTTAKTSTSTSGKKVIAAPASKPNKLFKPLLPGQDPEEMREVYIPEGTKTQAPAPSGRYLFEPGTDETDAIINEPDFSKFVLARYQPDNPEIRDVRFYPGYRNFDWTSKTAIEALNKSRNQMITRTSGVGHVGMPWTQLERDTMEMILREAFAAGVFRGDNVDWEQMGSELEKRLKDIVQPVDAVMAQPSRIAKGIEFSRGKPGKLAEARTGAPHRKAYEVENGARTFATIVLLIRENWPANHKVRRENPRQDRVIDVKLYYAAQAQKTALGNGGDGAASAAMSTTSAKAAGKRKAVTQASPSYVLAANKSLETQLPKKQKTDITSNTADNDQSSSQVAVDTSAELSPEASAAAQGFFPL